MFQENSLNILSTLIAIVTMVWAFFNFLQADNPKIFKDSLQVQMEKMHEQENVLMREINELQNRLVRRERENEQLQKNQIKSSTSGNGNLNRIKELENKIDKINETILDNPDKAISTLLMKNEIEHLKDTHGKEIEIFKSENLNRKEEIARVYDMTKWLLGLFFSMAVSVIIMNLTALNKAREDAQKKQG
jgi:hypothetical protein